MARFGKVLLLIVAIALVALPPSASAGGSTWKVEADSISVGDTVLVWASAAWSHNESLGTPEAGPYFAYVRPVDSENDYPWGPDERSIRVAEITIELGPYDDDGVLYGPNHAWFEFEVPSGPTGEWVIAHCNDPCTSNIGDITWGRFTVVDDETPPESETEAPTPTSTNASSVPTTTMQSQPAVEPVPPGTSLAVASPVAAPPATIVAAAASSSEGGGSTRLVLGGTALLAAMGAATTHRWRTRRA